jgi:predicted transcriptional regulator
MQKRKVKELDHHLKSIIDGVPESITNFRDNKLESKMTYYTGNWATDVCNNYTEKQSEKIFKKMAKIMDDPKLAFFQKKNKDIQIGTWSEYGEQKPETITSYEYIVMRKRG